jgi:hypothetical protein
MGSGLSAKRKAVCKKDSDMSLDLSVKEKIIVFKKELSDADSSDCDEDIREDHPVQPEPDFEQRRAMKLKGLIEENLETGKPMSPNQAIQYLIAAERASKAYGYQRHIDECMANLDIFPKENNFNRKEH